jgi:hypothetical protein
MSIGVELMICGMRREDAYESWLAETPDEITHYDVELRAIHRDSGDVEVLYEREELTADEANREGAMLERLFPHAAFEAIP